MPRVLMGLDIVFPEGTTDIKRARWREEFFLALKEMHPVDADKWKRVLRLSDLFAKSFPPGVEDEMIKYRIKKDLDTALTTAIAKHYGRDVALRVVYTVTDGALQHFDLTAKD